MGIYKRQGKWEIRLQLNGQKYYRQVPEAQNKQQALVAEATLRKEIYEGRYGRDGQEIGSTDFVKFCKEVYLPSARERHKDTHKLEWITRVLCVYFRGKRLKDITPMLVEGYKRARLSAKTKLGRPRHPATVKGEIGMLSSIFQMAIDNDLIGLNPCRKVRWARGQTVTRRERILTIDEEARLFSELKHHPEVAAAVRIALNTGMRRMEILRLKVSDIDTTSKTARFVGKGGKARTAPLNDEVFDVVAGLMATPAPGGYLFHNRMGNTLSANTCAFHLARKRAKVEGLRFHDLRHTFSSRVRQHTDAFTVRDLMGHSNVDTTDIYVTASLEEMRAAVDALSHKGKVLRFETKTG